MNDRTFCSEMQELKELLTALVVANGGSVNNTTGTTAQDDLYIQYPESTKDAYLEAGETFTRSMTIKRRLKRISVYLPEGCTLELKRDGQTFSWFYDEAGYIDLPSGIYIDTLEIIASNNGATDARWVCRLVFT